MWDDSKTADLEEYGGRWAGWSASLLGPNEPSSSIVEITVTEMWYSAVVTKVVILRDCYLKWRTVFSTLGKLGNLFMLFFIFWCRMERAM